MKILTYKVGVSSSPSFTFGFERECTNAISLKRKNAIICNPNMFVFVYGTNFNECAQINIIEIWN